MDGKNRNYVHFRADVEPIRRVHLLKGKVPSSGLCTLDTCLGQADPFPGPASVWITQATPPAFQSWLVLWMTVTTWTVTVLGWGGVGEGRGSGPSIDIHTKNNEQ